MTQERPWVARASLVASSDMRYERVAMTSLGFARAAADVSHAASVSASASAATAPTESKFAPFEARLLMYSSKTRVSHSREQATVLLRGFERPHDAPLHVCGSCHPVELDDGPGIWSLVLLGLSTRHEHAISHLAKPDEDAVAVNP